MVMPDGHRVGPVSVGKGTLAQATYKAAQLYGERKTLYENGLPQPSRPGLPAKPAEPTFGDAARIAVERLTERQRDTLKAQGYAKSNKFTVKRAVIQRVLLPNFDLVTWPQMRTVAREWLPTYKVDKTKRRKGKPAQFERPSQNTIGNLNHALQAVNDVAIEKGWISEFDKPKFSKRGFEQGSRQPSFEWDEVAQINGIMTDEWVNETDTTNRMLLRLYVALLATSGIRPGLEATSILPAQITVQKNKVVINIQPNQGKYKKSRTASCLNGSFDIKKLLDGFLKWRKENWSAEKTIQETRILANPATGSIPRLDRMLVEFLALHNILLDPITGKNRVPYSFRHFAISQAIRDDNDNQILCMIFGTSSAMIEKNYSHLKGEEAAIKAVGRSGKKQARIGFV